MSPKPAKIAEAALIFPSTSIQSQVILLCTRPSPPPPHRPLRHPSSLNRTYQLPYSAESESLSLPSYQKPLPTAPPLRRQFSIKKMADEEKNLIEILEEDNPIDISKYINYAHSPQCGAIATFSGTTRDTFQGKTVVELRYEAYIPMAVRCIQSICSSARSSWTLNAIAVAHRLGPVPVGETSVFIAISAVHRADALDACKYVIDEIKSVVPIWKKEVYSNGEVWKENSEFLERRPEIKKGCCGMKVKVDDGAHDS